MDEFPDLLVRCSRALGTMLAVAVLLEVEPRQVYQWIAGVELPTHQRISELAARLHRVLS
jgi:DNA-binding transcriptional regulator YdaS (Cro superfamily)